MNRRPFASFRQLKSGAAVPLSAIILGMRLLLPAQANEPPQISYLPPYTITESTHTGPLLFTVMDAETAPDQLSVRVTSSNLTLVPEADACAGATAGFCISGTGSNQTVDIFPMARQVGISQISIIVTDQGGLSATNSFNLLVQDAQVLVFVSSLPDRITVPAGETTPPIPFRAEVLNGSADDLLLDASTSDATLIPKESVTFAGSGTNRTVTVHAAPTRMGQATVTITGIEPEGMSQAASFGLTVSARLEAVRELGELILSWGPTNAILQATSNIGGVWSNISINSPVRLPTNAGVQLFRLKKR